MLKPLAILFNGLAVYQPSPLTPLDPLASRLRDAGFETCITNHLNTGCRDLRAPSLIIGHSQGGATALTLAQRFPSALVITFDSVRHPRCIGHCINFVTPGYVNVSFVRGAQSQNIPVPGEHITFVLSPSLQQRVVIHATNHGTVYRMANDRPDAQKGRGVLEPSRTRNPRTEVGQRGSQDRGPSVPSEEFASYPTSLEPDDEPLLLADRWPNESFGELTLTFEQACIYVHYTGCPK